jgi:OPA family glycerol-3-phosphate transporter-like MFS transporter
VSATSDKVSPDLLPAPASAGRFRKLQWRMLFVTMFCYLFYYTGRQTFGFAIPGIQAELGVSKATLGAISGALLWTYAIGQAVNGNLTDKFGGRKLMSLGAVLSTILNWCTSFGTGPKSLAMTWAANGYAQAMGWPAGGRVLSNWWGPAERGKTFGYYTFAAGMASVLAYVTSTLVVDTFGLNWRWIFRVPVLLMLVGGVVFYLVARDRPKDAGITPPAQFTAADDAEGTGPDGSSVVARYRAVLRNPKIWSTGIAIGFQNSARYGLLSGCRSTSSVRTGTRAARRSTPSGFRSRCRSGWPSARSPTASSPTASSAVAETGR